jgi:hypothetical protein
MKGGILMKKKILAIITGIFVISLTACQSAGSSVSVETGTRAESSTDTAASTTEIAKTESVSVDNEINLASPEDLFTDRDYEGTYENEQAITLNGNSISTEADGVAVNGSTLTITKEGTYLLSGELDNGQIIVDAADEDKVQIVLNGVSITNESSAAIYVKNADKVFLTLAEGTENSVSTTGTFVDTDENSVDGAVFSKSTLTVNGKGSLTVSSTAHGIVSKDDLKVMSGEITINAEKSGLCGKDSVRIAGGTLTITAGSNGIKSDNEEDADKGYVYIVDGSITVSKSKEGLEGNNIMIAGGSITLNAGDDGVNINDESGTLIINDGSLTVYAKGDGLDSNGDILMNGGTVTVFAPDNGGNGTIDVGEAQNKAVASGAAFIGLGVSGMNVQFDSSSTNGCILVTLDSSYEAGTKVTLTDASGNTVLETEAVKTFNSVQLSSPSIEAGQTYTLTVGSDVTEITMESNLYGEGQGFGGHGAMGEFGNHENGEFQQGERPEMLEGGFQNGERPEMPEGGFQNGERPEGHEWRPGKTSDTEAEADVI